MSWWAMPMLFILGVTADQVLDDQWDLVVPLQTWSHPELWWCWYLYWHRSMQSAIVRGWCGETLGRSS